MLAAVILTGGKSSRMGTNKSSLPLPQNGLSLLEHCQATLADAYPSVVWVSGEDLVDLVPQCGPMSGIHAALEHGKTCQVAPTELLVVPVDMPDLSVDLIHELIEKGRDAGLLCCFENHYLPLYIAITPEVLDYVSGQLLDPADTSQANHKQSRYSIQAMLKHLGGIQIPAKQLASLTNINTPQQWQQYCSKQNQKVNN
jgi:molybdopterin-guanine dinucleotide biosynthesis protein A